MRRPFAQLLLAAVLFASPAWAASGLEAARHEASQARAHVNEIRARQMAMRSELNQLAQKIEALKAKQKGALITGSELDASLQHSQELSGALTEAAQQMSQAQSELEKDNLALLTALNQELESARDQWDRQRDRKTRAALLKQMRSLRAEREQIRAMLPASQVPALQTAGSDDPEDLLEQADALRDSEDKVRVKMKALQARIDELREERDLDRRMNDFLGDEAMFDDSDRRLRRTRQFDVSQQSQPPLFGGAPAAEADSSASAPGATTGFENSSSPAPGGGTGGTGSGDNSKTAPAVNLTQIVKSADARPQIGNPDALLLGDTDSGDLNTLEAQLKKLDSLAKQLGQRANEMEQKARDSE